MKFVVRWMDCEETVETETMGMVALMDVLKAHKMAESDACLLLCRMVEGCPVKVLDPFSYDLVLEKVEG